MKSTLFAMMLLLAACQAAFATITPFYENPKSDATWTDQGGGVWTVPLSAEVYEFEIWERPVQDSADAFTDNVGTNTRTLKADNLYYSYIDLSFGDFGAGNSMGDDYLFIRWDVVGDFKDDKGDQSSVGHEGHYYFYFEPSGGASQDVSFIVEIPGGNAKDLGTDYSTDADIKVYKDSNGDVPVPGTQTGGTSHEGTQLNATSEQLTRRNGNTVEAAIKLEGFGDGALTVADFDDLNYAYIGVAVSNPSSPITDVFAHDFYSDGLGEGVEYDTIGIVIGPGVFAIPEPSSFLLLALVAAPVGIGLTWRRLLGG